MKGYRFFAALGIFVSVLSCCMLNVCASGTGKTEDLVLRYQQDTGCKCVSVVVLDHGELIYYGDNERLYQIGSMTKAFTGLAIQKLIAGGLLDENGKVSDYIAGFETYYDSEKVDITIKDLLEQKSGFTNNEKDNPPISETMTLSEWADSVSGFTLKCRPGTEYAYSNVNYDLLGAIVEKVSGMTYRDYMEQEILIPLGLDNTYVGKPSKGTVAEGTRLGYRHVYDFPMSVKEASIPAGYFYSDTEDMGRWLQIWTGSISVPEGFCRPLSKTKEYLRKEGDYYSGWECFSEGVTGHSGGTPNYSSRIIFDEKNGTGVCVLCNLNVAATTDSLCNGIFDIVSGKTSPELAGDIWTIFDKIFTGVTLTGILLFPITLMLKKRSALIILDTILISLLALVIILFPVIFGSGMKDILFTWAPWSLTGGLGIIASDIILITVKILTVNNHGAHNKTGKR